MTLRSASSLVFPCTKKLLLRSDNSLLSFPSAYYECVWPPPIPPKKRKRKIKIFFFATIIERNGSKIRRIEHNQQSSKENTIVHFAFGEADAKFGQGYVSLDLEEVKNTVDFSRKHIIYTYIIWF